MLIMKTLFIFLLLLQIQTNVSVTVQVRYLNGDPFLQTIQLRNDEGEPLQTCQPDADGRCTMQLARGLYLVEPTGTQLDAVSAAAAVEIGGQWLAITVGDRPLDYSFVIDEGAVYFDDAPNSARPQPIRPTQADLEAHFVESDTEVEAATTIEPELVITPNSAENMPTAESAENEIATTPESAETPTPDATTVLEQSAETIARNRLTRWIVFIVTLTLGAAVIWWLAARKTA